MLRVFVFMHRISQSFFVGLFFSIAVSAQEGEPIFNDQIKSIQLFVQGNSYSFPVIKLGSNEKLELHFDDFDNRYKSLYYSIVLCNADWSEASVQAFDYIKGFQSNKINTYRSSTIVNTRYVHYQAALPDNSAIITKSGNYILKVHENSDSKNPYFIKRFIVIDNKLMLSAQVLAPFRTQDYLSSQRINVAIKTDARQINPISPQSLMVSVMQNNSWAITKTTNRPNIYRGNYYEYNSDDLSFAAGKEWRWADLRTFRMRGDRVGTVDDTGDEIEVVLKPDFVRERQLAIQYNDMNGAYHLENLDGYNPYWQSEYAHVHFTFSPPGNQALAGQDVYVFGALTNYQLSDTAKMIYNDSRGVYEKSLYLKQGYYDYSYIAKPYNVDADKFQINFNTIENSSSNTENIYRVIVYHRPFGSRTDEVVGYAEISSRGILQ